MQPEKELWKENNRSLLGYRLFRVLLIRCTWCKQDNARSNLICCPTEIYSVPFSVVYCGLRWLTFPLFAIFRFFLESDCVVVAGVVLFRLLFVLLFEEDEETASGRGNDESVVYSGVLTPLLWEEETVAGNTSSRLLAWNKRSCSCCHCCWASAGSL